MLYTSISMTHNTDWRRDLLDLDLSVAFEIIIRCIVKIILTLQPDCIVTVFRGSEM